MTDVIEDTVDDIIVPEDPENPGDDIITSPTIRTVAGWKAWVRHNTPNINGCLKAHPGSEHTVPEVRDLITR